MPTINNTSQTSEAVEELKEQIANLAYNTSLTDVDVSGLAAGGIPKWDGTKWIMDVDAGGIPDTSDAQDYVGTLGSWKLLSSTTDITNLNSGQTTQNNGLDTIEAEQITQNGAISSNTSNLSNLQT